MSEDRKNGKIKDSNQSNNHLLLYILGLGKSLVLGKSLFYFYEGAPYESALSTGFSSVSAGPKIIKYIY